MSDQIIIKRKTIISDPVWDYMKRIGQIMEWYHSLPEEVNRSKAITIYTELKSQYKELCECNVYLSKDIGDLFYLYQVMEHTRKREMSKNKVAHKDKTGDSLELSGDIARAKNKVHDQNAAAAAGNYREAMNLWSSVERMLAAMNQDIQRMEREMAHAGITIEKWKPVFDELELNSTEIKSLKKEIEWLKKQIADILPGS